MPLINDTVALCIDGSKLFTELLLHVIIWPKELTLYEKACKHCANSYAHIRVGETG